LVSVQEHVGRQFVTDLALESHYKPRMRMFLLVMAMALGATVWADDLATLQGKWTVKKTGDRGAYTQQIEFKDKKFIFKILGADDAVAFIATGEVELKKQGPFNTARFFGLKAGRSDTELESVDEERNSVYLLDGGQFYLASNFDKARDREKPSVDAYSKAN
jgi:hypothetical protein